MALSLPQSVLAVHFETVHLDYHVSQLYLHCGVAVGVAALSGTGSLKINAGGIGIVLKLEVIEELVAPQELDG